LDNARERRFGNGREPRVLWKNHADFTGRRFASEDASHRRICHRPPLHVMLDAAKSVSHR
jgi:hypothetical protein